MARSLFLYFCGADAGPDCAPAFAGFLFATFACDAAESTGGFAALLPRSAEEAPDAAPDAAVADVAALCAWADSAVNSADVTTQQESNTRLQCVFMECSFAIRQMPGKGQ